MTSQPYSSIEEHLDDELAWLDEALELAIQQFGAQGRPAEFERFGGLLLDQREVAEALAKEPSGRLRPDGPKARDWERRRAVLDGRKHATLEAGHFLPFIQLGEVLHLDAFEQQCLLLSLAPELDRKYERVFAFLQDDVTRKLPTVDLALALFCEDRTERWKGIQSFQTGSVLRRFEIIDIVDPPEGPLPLQSRRLKLDDRITHFLLGSSELDGRLQSWAEIRWDEEAPMPKSLEDVADGLRSLLGAHFAEASQPSLILNLFGPYGVGRERVAAAVAGHIGLPILWIDVRKLVSSERFASDVRHTFREALLAPAAVGIRHFQDLMSPDAPDALRLEVVIDAIKRYSRLTFLIAEESWTPIGVFGDETFLSVKCPAPGYRERATAWQEILAGETRVADPMELASKFRFTGGQARDAYAEARARHLVHATADEPLDAAGLHAACRNQGSPHLDALARKIEPVFTWDDIILPDNQLAQLKEIVAHVRHAQIVMGQWGFSRRFPLGGAVTALCAGGSGTGKTMAAEILANDLQLDLYKIDLSGVVSKYIGETEKNLNRIFEEAQNSNAILFFDEADALFGKRSEVKDSHDRYANIEVAYLLQRMEEYDGVVILATNLKKNMDDAFVRRMRFIIDFPFPDRSNRERIWRKVFPDTAPVENDVDFDFLARRLKITGGNIKNISLRAAYGAVDRGLASIDMACLIESAKHELDKVGKLYTEEEFGRFAMPRHNGSPIGTSDMVEAVTR